VFPLSNRILVMGRGSGISGTIFPKMTGIRKQHLFSQRSRAVGQGRRWKIVCTCSRNLGLAVSFSSDRLVSTHMESIAAAVISAIASIAVAVINQRYAATSRRHREAKTEAPDLPGPSLWAVSVVIVIVWVLVAPYLTRDPNLLTISFFAAVPLATLVLAYLTAPPPLLAASGVLAIHAVNAGVMSFSTVPGFTLGFRSRSDFTLLLGAFALNAVLAALAAKWRRRQASRGVEHVASPRVPEIGFPAAGDLIEQLTTLTKLRDEGKLTEEEFSAAKRKLLQ
jgi:hypothetical protein